ncbi:MAG: hypothetical protein ACJ763_11550 [Bdellovibrionia bacterium]
MRNKKVFGVILGCMILSASAFAQEFKAQLPGIPDPNEGAAFKDYVPFSSLSQKLSDISVNVKRTDLFTPRPENEDATVSLPASEEGQCYVVGYHKLEYTDMCTGLQLDNYARTKAAQVKIHPSPEAQCYAVEHQYGRLFAITPVVLSSRGGAFDRSSANEICSRHGTKVDTRIFHAYADFASLKKELEKNEVNPAKYAHATKEAPCIKKAEAELALSLKNEKSLNYLNLIQTKEVTVEFTNNTDGWQKDSNLTYGPEITEEKSTRLVLGVIVNTKGQCKYATAKQLNDTFSTGLDNLLLTQGRTLGESSASQSAIAGKAAKDSASSGSAPSMSDSKAQAGLLD